MVLVLIVVVVVVVLVVVVVMILLLTVTVFLNHQGFQATVMSSQVLPLLLPCAFPLALSRSVPPHHIVPESARGIPALLLRMRGLELPPGCLIARPTARLVGPAVLQEIEITIPWSPLLSWGRGARFGGFATVTREVVDGQV